MVLSLRLDAEYVLDKMQLYEVRAFMNYGYYASKDGWEQARLNAYMTAQVNSTKELKPSDILPFPWEDQKEKDTTITEQDIARLKKKAEAWQKAQQHI